MTLDQLNELEDEFYGEEENEDDEGVFENDYELAEWARSSVPDLFNAIRELLEAKE